MAAGDRIPASETLYRSVDPENIVGDGVLDDAVEMPACSFNRSSMSVPQAALSPKTRPNETRIMEVMVGNLPQPIARPSDGIVFEFLAIHWPEPGADSHSEVQLTPLGSAFRKTIRRQQEFMDLAKGKLAAQMRVRPEGTASHSEPQRKE